MKAALVALSFVTLACGDRRSSSMDAAADAPPRSPDASVDGGLVDSEISDGQPQDVISGGQPAPWGPPADVGFTYGGTG